MKRNTNRSWLANYLVLALILLISSCIGDDIIEDEVEPQLRIGNVIDTLGIGSEYLFEANYLNNVGQVEVVPVQWSSSDPAIVSVSDEGLAVGQDYGSVVITATATANGGSIQSNFSLAVGDVTSNISSIARAGTIQSTSSYRLMGDFNIIALDEGQLRLVVEENYEASRALPGLYVYLSNNPNSISDAFEIARVEVFEGRHEYIISGVGLFDFDYVLYYCKPFNVKVGDGKIED